MSCPKRFIAIAKATSVLVAANDVLIWMDEEVTAKTVACEAIPLPTIMSPAFIPLTAPVPPENVMMSEPFVTFPLNVIGLPGRLAVP